ncbi:TPA: glycine cleavage system protein GcvH [Morganella morganii]
MSNIPENLKYTEDHEWVRHESGDEYVAGITYYAQELLGDVVFVELPEVGDEITFGEAFGTVESVKAASDLYAPVTGTVIAVNEALEDSPELVNSEPYEGGWMIRIKIADPDEFAGLMDAAKYAELQAEEQD